MVNGEMAKAPNEYTRPRPPPAPHLHFLALPARRPSGTANGVRAGPVQYTVVNFLEKNDQAIGKNLLDLLDDGCTNELVGVGSRNDRCRCAH